MLVIAAVVLSLVAVCALAALVLQGFFYSRRVGLLWLAMVLLGSFLGATAEYRDSAVWIGFAAIYVLLVAAAVVVLATVVARNIREPAIYWPLSIFAVALLAAAILLGVVFTAPP